MKPQMLDERMDGRSDDFILCPTLCIALDRQQYWVSYHESQLQWRQTDNCAESCSAVSARSEFLCLTCWHCSTNSCFSNACSKHTAHFSKYSLNANIHVNIRP